MVGYLLGIISRRFGRVAIAMGLAIGMLALGAASSWAVRELVGFNNYTLFKFADGQVDDWTQKVQGNGTVKYECTDPDASDPTVSCQVVVDAIGICGANQNIVYTCDDGAELILLPSGVLLVPDDCDGDCV